MTKCWSVGAAFIALVIAGPSLAQGLSNRVDGPIVVAQAQTEDTSRRKRPKRAASSKKEPTVNQMAARERQKKCAAEWKEVKAGGKVASGMKWPKYWSQCNARLKGNAV